MVFECKGLENRVNDIESSITDLNNEKLDKTAVVQETGTGTDVVMSQKAVTDAIASADPTAEKLHEVIKGTSTVTVDLSQDQQTLNVALDKSQEVQYVELTPTTATQGILTDTQWNVLQVNKGNCIILNNEIYRLADNQNVNGLITYVHTGWDGTARKDKSISITVSTKAWTLVVAEGGGGGKLYNHWIKIGVADYNFYLSINDNREEAYTAAELSTRYMKGSGFVGLPAVSQQVDANSYTGNVVINVSSGYIFYQGVIPYIEGTSTTPTAIRKSAVTIQSFTDTVTEL